MRRAARYLEQVLPRRDRAIRGTGHGARGTGHGGNRVRNGWRSPMSRFGTMERAPRAPRGRRGRRWAPRVMVCVLGASGVSAFAQPVQYLTPPRPPAPVYNGADLAAVNATIERFNFDFVTVGAPGNRSWIESERFFPNGWTPNHIDDRGDRKRG